MSQALARAASAQEIPEAAPPRDFRSPRVDLNGKTVLITGGTGSFGKAFVKMVCAEFAPKKLIVFSRDELKQYEMAQRFPPERYSFMRYFIGDVRDAARLQMAFRGVDYVIHAAALLYAVSRNWNPSTTTEPQRTDIAAIAEPGPRKWPQKVFEGAHDGAAASQPPGGEAALK